MSIARDGRLARDHARGRVASALRHPLPVPLPPEDQAVVDRLRAAYDAFEHATAASRHRELVPDRFVDLFALAGAPDEVAAQVRRVMEVTSIGRIIILPQVPDRAFVDREEILKVFAEEVMARVA
jgi:5,10-methylenetetrahydromethanopterin reductase